MFLCLCFFLSCDKYYNSQESFDRILLKKNTDIYIKKVELFKYKKNTSFNILESRGLEFEIFNDTINNELYLNPKFDNQGVINSDLLLLINDSLEIRISDIKTIRDTVVKSFTLSKRFYIENKIYSFKLNHQTIINDDYSISLSLDNAKVTQD